MVLRKAIDGIACASAFFDICLRASVIARTRAAPSHRAPLRSPPPPATNPFEGPSSSASRPPPLSVERVVETSAEEITEATPATPLAELPEPPRVEPHVEPAVEPIAEPEVTPVESARPSAEPITELSSNPVTPVDELAKTFQEDAFAQNAPVPSAGSNISYSAVPSTRIGRLFHYGGLATDLSLGAASEAFRRATGGVDDGTGGPSYFMSESSVRRIVARLSRMRGAALKIGQFASMQGAKVLPPQIEQIMLRVQNTSHFMPRWQVDEVMTNELGPGWRDRYREFNMTPMNSASIGQVHHARLHDGRHVAVKVQYPGVANSIKSDLKNIALILTAGSLLPRGLFLDNSIAVLGRELADECDYLREAELGRRFGELLAGDPDFTVPAVIDDLCTPRVLTAEYVFGTPLSRSDDLSQELRDEIGRKILRLCLRELLHFSLMQTDPNWSNFLWNGRTKKIELIDFGASRQYTEAFVDDYLALLRAAIDRDHDRCVALSQRMGYLTGDETDVMVNAHVESMLAVAEPFMPDAPRPFAFGDQTITDRVRAQIPVMLRHRLTPPPTETYSLNRKLSGCFLLCARLKSRVDCVGMLAEVVEAMQPNRSCRIYRKAE